jgi:hypothetical protein
VSLKQFALKIKPFFLKLKKEGWEGKLEGFLFVLSLFLIFSLIYGIGLMQSVEKPEKIVLAEGLKMDYSVLKSQKEGSGSTETTIFASKNGTKYYFASC